MRSKQKKTIMILGIIFGIFFLLMDISIFNDNLGNNNKATLKSSGYWVISPFIIDDDGGAGITWAQAAGQPWCNYIGGVYVIENVTVNAGNIGDAIKVEDSAVPFRIENCTVYNAQGSAGMAGLKLINVDNGQIINNNLSNNQGHGMIFWGSTNNNVSGNTINSNVENGIDVFHCEENTISNNTILNNHFGISLRGGIGATSNNNNISCNIINKNGWGISIEEQCTNNNISGNTVNTNANQGISIEDNSEYNLVSGNTVKNNSNIGIWVGNSLNLSIVKNIVSDNSPFGIMIIESTLNYVSGNVLFNNTVKGLFLFDCSDNIIHHNEVYNNSIGIELASSYENNFSSNTIQDNYNYGVSIINNSTANQENLFYYNIFENPLGINANDSGSGNFWDNGIIGNYWHDYGGVDNNDDGIGDTPYIIPGSAIVSIDNKPIFSDDPVITIASPSDSDVFANTPPNFEIISEMGAIDTLWYGLSNETFTSDNTTVSELTGNIDLNIWNAFGNDNITIIFYANDSAGKIGFDEVTVGKDITQPIISIISPSEGDFFGTNTPNFNISIIEENLESTWYKLSDGIITIDSPPIIGLTGSIDQTIWDALGDGTVTISFYVNDTGSNIGFDEITVTKDSIVPTITINSPSDDETFVDPPNFNISIIEENLESTWYKVEGDTAEYPFTGEIGTIDEDAWNGTDYGQITITFYARDEIGNIGSESVTIIKSSILIPPTIPTIPGYNVLMLYGILFIALVFAIRKRNKF